MKNIFKIILATIALVACANAATQPSRYSCGATEWEIDSVKTASGFDTLAATDSSTLYSLYPVRNGYDYVILFNTITGTGSDSIAFVFRYDCYNASKTLMYRFTSTDTISSATGNIPPYLTPLNWKIPGVRYVTIKAITITGAGTQAIINGYSLMRLRPVSVNAPWPKTW